MKNTNRNLKLKENYKSSEGANRFDVVAGSVRVCNDEVSNIEFTEAVCMLR